MEIIRHYYPTQNVGKQERAISVIAGSLLLYDGIRRRNWTGLTEALSGVALVHRGVTGYCAASQALGINTAAERDEGNLSVPYELGIRVDRAVTVNRSRAEVYRYWRDFSNLPQFMQHLESVKVIDSKRSHWCAKGPAGRTVQWDAEIVNEVEGELIGWRSVGKPDVENAGSVQFRDAAGGRGTVVHVTLQYNPPAGILGALYAKLWGAEPSQQIEADLRNFKALLETGERPTNQGQSSGRASETTAASQQKIHDASEASFPASDAPSYSH